MRFWVCSCYEAPPHGSVVHGKIVGGVATYALFMSYEEQ